MKTLAKLVLWVVVLAVVTVPVWAADTQRSLTSLQSLLADNTTGDISPQDLRDFLVSSQGGYGSISLYNVAVAQGSISATPAKMTGWDTNGISSGTTPDHTSDDITVATAGDYLVTGHISFIGTANKTFRADVYYNSAVTSYGVERKLGTGADTGSIPISALITSAASKTICIYISSSDGGTSFTPTYGSLVVTRVQ